MNKSRTRTKKSLIFSRLGLGFLGLLLLMVIGAAWFKAVKVSVWNGHDRLSLIDLGENRIELINILPAEKKQLIWQVPADLMVEVPFGYGRYQLKKVYQLGELDRTGGSLLLRTASNLFGLKIDAYRVMGRTNLSWWDQLRLSWINRTKAFQTNRLDLTGQISRLDQLVNENLFDTRLAKEAVPIAVLNASGVAGEANQVARLITNIGGQVVTIGNSDNLQEKSEIWINADKLKDSVTLKFLQTILGPVPIRLEPLTLQYRADIVILVGELYAKPALK